MYLQGFNHEKRGEVSLRKISAPVQLFGEYGVRKKKIRRVFQILVTSNWVWYTKLHRGGCCHRDNDQMCSYVEVIVYSKCVWELLLCVWPRRNLITFLFPYDNPSCSIEFQKLWWLLFLLLRNLCSTYDWIKYSLGLLLPQAHLTRLENILFL